MNSVSPVVFPAASSVALFLVGVSIAMIALHTTLLALAAARAKISRRAKILVPLLAGGVLAGWLAWAILAVPARVTVPEIPPDAGRAVQRPELLLEMAAFVMAGAIALFTSKSLRTVNAAMPPAWLIGAQVYRIAGFIFIWPFFTGGALSPVFALPAGIGDALIGLAAPLVAWAVANKQPGAHKLAIAWNWLGILDLIVAPVAAVLAQSTNIGRFPLVVVPLFLGPPLGILTHLYSLRNLRAQAKTFTPLARSTGDLNVSTASVAS